MRVMAVVGALTAIAVTTVRAQESQVEVHGNYVYGTRSKSNAWGVGGNYQLTWGGSSAPVKLATSIGPDYTKQEKGGPSQTSLSVDATLEPGGDAAVTPYAGGSASANWSGGDQKQWSGTKLGREVVAGASFKLGASSKLSGNVEERYGYVDGQEHTLTSRLGLALSF
ncbi:MAG: hypothetical protein M3081_06970 [Gemmatimonadota bacterium]|nr:hypothetical protein [Gemmatimonadota bacterium]